MDRGRREVRPVGRSELGDPGAQGGAVQLADRSAAEGRQRVRAEVLRVACLRARPQVGHRRPPTIPPLGDSDAAQPGVDERALQPVDLDEVDVRLGVPLALELPRSLLAVRRPVAHQVGPRAVCEVLLDDRSHAPCYVSGAHQVHRPCNTGRYETTRSGRKDLLRDHLARSVQRARIGCFAFTPWRSWVRVPHRPLKPQLNRHFVDEVDDDAGDAVGAGGSGLPPPPAEPGSSTGSS